MKFWHCLVIVLAVLILSCIAYFGFNPNGRMVFNEYKYSLRKIDDRTTYEQRKEVEDTCRAMISSWNFDVLTYKQYKDADTAEKQGWAEQAKMRANKTAASYNEYILKNSFVWAGNIPADIYAAIDYIE